MAGLVKRTYRPEYRVMLARLRQARKGAGLDQKAVAVRFRRPQSFVSKCESGERRIDPIELLDFARLYGRPVDFFLGGDDEENQLMRVAWPGSFRPAESRRQRADEADGDPGGLLRQLD